MIQTPIRSESSYTRACETVRALQAGRPSFGEHLARRLVDILSREGVAYASFDAFGRLFKAEAIAPGTWMYRTAIVYLDSPAKAY